MGAAESQGVYSQIQLNHPALRNCRALTKNNLTFLQASVTCQRPQYQQWNQQQNDFNLHESDSEYLLLPLKHKFEEGGVCSTAGELNIEYQYYPKLLSSEIQDRIHDKKRFSQAQLWYLLYVMVSARQALVIQGMEVGNLQPRNIFLNANQQAKVANVLSWPGYVSNYKSAILEESFEYLSPEDIVRIKLGAMDNKNNTQSEIFAMGMTLLQASCLQPMKDLYRLKQRDLDEQLFGTRLALFQHDRIYSEIYRAVVCNLLEMDPIKRMCQQQLVELLFKHRDNLESKKPLMFDNVGKKLQQSINNLLKVVPSAYPPINNSIVRGSRANSRSSREAPTSNHHINNQELNTPHPLRPSSAHSVDKNRKVIINHELGGSNAKVPISPSQNRKIIFNPPSQVPPPPLPLYIPPKPIYPHLESSRNPPTFIVQNIQGTRKQSQPKQVFRPFQNINAAILKGQQNSNKSQPFIQQSKVQQIMTAQRTHEEGEEKSMVTQLMMQTRRGFFVEMSKIERKQSKAANLAQNSVIKTKTDSSIMIEETVKEESSKQKANQIPNIPTEIEKKEDQVDKNITQISPLHVSEVKKEVKQVEDETQLQLQKGYQQHLNQKLSGVQLSEVQPEPKNITKVQSHQSHVKIESSNEIKNDEKQIAAILPIKDTQNNNNENEKASAYSNSRASSDNKSSQANKFAPTVKIWGMQKGKIVVQQVGTLQPSIPKSSSQKSPQIPKERQTQTPNKCQSPEIINNIAQETHSQKQVTYSDKYILIQQPSKAASEIVNENVENKIIPGKKQAAAQTHHYPDNKISRTSNARSQSSERMNNFIFLQVSTEGSFEQCWEQLIKMTKEPHSYHNLIKPQKVQPLQNEYGQYLKVGPARMKVNLNKQQGKIWLQNLGSSLCQGDLLAGVVKKQDKFHYIWVNSSLRYKAKYFPSKQIMEEGLQVAQRNIQVLHRD